MASRRSRYVAPTGVRESTPSELLGPLPPTELIYAPPRIFVAGNLNLLEGPPRVAIIGSREVSEDGRKRAAKLARALVEAGIVVVSGLAKGVDRTAHETAIASGGKTIAVIGTPLDRCYPAEHADLQMMLCREHLVLSQFTPGTRVFPSNFPQRNRFMALLAHASVIIEAGNTSGSLSQAAETQRLGRPLFIAKSLLERSDLYWPPKFLKAGARVLEDSAEVIGAVA